MSASPQRTRPGIAIAAVALTLFAASARGRGTKKRVKLVARKIARISLADRDRSPTFVAADVLRPMDRDRAVFIGTGSGAEQYAIHLLRLRDARRLTLRLPFARFVREHPSIRLPAVAAKPLHEQFMVKRLLYYDRKDREAGVELVDRVGSGRVRRHFFFHWDVASGKLAATLVARERPGVSYENSLPVGYDPGRHEFYYVRQLVPKRGGRRKVYLIGFARGKPRVVASLKATRRLHRRTYFDRVHRQALLVEYAERKGGGKRGDRPRGYLVELGRGKVRSFPIPPTTYAAAFSESGHRLYVYSAQLGELWTFALPSTRRLHVTRVGKLGYELGWLSSGKLLLVRNHGLQLIRAGDSPRRGQLIPMRAIYGGFSHVLGSRVVGGAALVKNGEQLHIVRLVFAAR